MFKRTGSTRTITGGSTHFVFSCASGEHDIFLKLNRSGFHGLKNQIGWMSRSGTLSQSFVLNVLN